MMITRALPRARAAARPALRAAVPRSAAMFALLLLATAALAAAGIALGSISIPLGEVWNGLVDGDAQWSAVIGRIRVPRTLAALLSGAALGVAGLQMQTLFRNPLADPFVLGISAGASLGVAAAVLLAGSSAALFASGLGWFGELGVAGAAVAGAGIVMALVLLLSLRVRSIVTVLVIGLLVGYLVASLIAILLASAQEALVDQYIRWGFGSFRGVTWSELRILAPAAALGIALAAGMSKQLNLLLLGESYARSLGVRVLRAQIATMLGAALLAGAVTAFAGPIAFLGVAIPHLARSLFRTSDHRLIVPAAALCGAAVAMAAEIAAQLPGLDGALPLNAVTALIGAPVVLAVLLRRRRLAAV